MRTSFILNLLFFSLVLLAMSFTTKHISAGQLPGAQKSASNSNAFFSFATAPAVDFKAIVNKTRFQQMDGDDLFAKWNSKQSKFKKKVKRWCPTFSGIRYPVKEILPTVFNVFSKKNYSKPHFLSLLHHFLFRLTPF